MKKTKKKIFRTILISVLTFTLFLSIGYIFVSKNLKKVNTKIEDVPYTQETPNNVGILFNINGDKTYAYLDFDEKKMIISLSPEEPFENEIYGYPLDFELNATTNLISEVADYLNGIVLDLEDGKYRYTGSQIKDILSEKSSKDFKTMLVKSICDRISESRIQVDFFAKIIENSQTNINILDCYFWDDYINDVCKNLYFID